MADVRQPLHQPSSDADQVIQQLIQYLSSQQRFIDQQQSIIRGQEQLIQVLSGLVATMPQEGLQLQQNVNTGKEGLEQLRVSLMTRLETLKQKQGATASMSPADSALANALGRVADALRPIEPPSKQPEQKVKPSEPKAPLSATVDISPDEAKRVLTDYDEQKRSAIATGVPEIAPETKAGVTFLELDVTKPKQRVQIPSGTTKIGRTDRAYFSDEGPQRLKGKFGTPSLIVLVEDPNKQTISSVHGYIVNDGFKLTYYDSSSNGSFVKGLEDSQYSPVMGGNRQTEEHDPIPDFRVLRDGDQVRFGPRSHAITVAREEVEERRGVKQAVWYFLT